jgi:hypothetical protein
VRLSRQPPRGPSPPEGAPPAPGHRVSGYNGHFHPTDCQLAATTSCPVLWRSADADHCAMSCASAACCHTPVVERAAAAEAAAAARPPVDLVQQEADKKRAKAAIAKTGVAQRDKMRELLAEDLAMALPEAVRD